MGIKFIIDYIKNNKRVIAVISVLIIIACICIAYASNCAKIAEEKAEKAQSLTVKQTQDINSLQNKLNINKKNAELLKEQLSKAQENNIQPVAHFTVSAPTPQVVVKEVTQRINDNDTTLPPESLEKSDRTVVAEQPDNKDYQVCVYKINLRKNWEIGVGASYIDNNGYADVALKRNYDKVHSISVTGHFKNGTEPDGIGVMWWVAK